MRVLAFTRYERLGSSSRVRFYQYFPFLESHHVKIVNAPFFKDEYVRNLYAGRRSSPASIVKAYLTRLTSLLNSRSFDLLWVEKELLPWFPAGMEMLFRSSQIPYVVDYDDAVFHRYNIHSFVPIRWLLGNKIDHIMRHAKLVIAGNEYIAERARKAGAKRVEYLPSVVDVSQYVFKPREADPIFKIGWIGSPVTARYLDMIHEVVNTLNQESDICLVLIGAGNSQSFSDVPTEILPWSEDNELIIGQKFDVGIMPLVDGPFERGKCGYKLVQYMAGGIPVVASPVGVNRQIVESGVNGYLANSTEDWLVAMRTLRDNPQKRVEMGQAGHHKAEELYNLKVTAPKLLDLLTSAVKK